jgi:hypothetical protein
MNRELRKHLIDHARTKGLISYGKVMQQLGLDNNIKEHRNLLSEELAEISRFEHRKERPMLSSMAVYADKKVTGPGFYELAEELGYGEASYLRRADFSKTMQKRCHDFWINPANYTSCLADTGETDTVDAATQPDFFTQEDLNFFSLWIDHVYDKSDAAHVAAKNRVMDTIGSKVVYWAQQLAKRVDAFTSYNPRIWLKQGWDDSSGTNERVVKFKHYSWARLFKEQDRGKDIFFTVQADGAEKALIYKLDYFFEKYSKLSFSQKGLCKQLIPDELKWIEISYDDIPEYSWERLLDETETFICENEKVYDHTITSVWTGVIDVPKLSNRLIRRETPHSGIDALPTRNFEFVGFNTDWQKKNEQAENCGSIGEELVMEYEKAYLERYQRTDLASKVAKMQDGKGYDILSYHPDGSEKHIEVKTTTGNEETPFFISINEIMYSEKYPESYYLYRVFNLKLVSRIAEFHEYKGNLQSTFLFEPVGFVAHRKQQQPVRCTFCALHLA